MPGYGPNNTPLQRFDAKYIRNALFRILNLEKGIGYTLWNLSVRPGTTLNTYLFEDRSKLAKPIGFLLLTATVATFLTVKFIDFQSIMFSSSTYQFDFSQKDIPFDDLMARATELFTQYYNLLTLAGVPILAIGSYALFSEYRYNFVEHLIISAYATALITMLYIFTFPLFVYAYEEASFVYLLAFFAYLAFMYTQIFKCSIWKGILKTLVILLIYQIVFSMILVMIGFFLGMNYVLQNSGG